MKKAYSIKILLAIAVSLATVAGSDRVLGESWKFGVICDTQWVGKDDGKNTNTVAVAIIDQLNRQLIKHGVKFVIQTGDLSNDGSPLALDTRATFAQALYNAGIGFFPIRGNHDASQAGAIEFQRVFPQTRNGVNNATPTDAMVTTADYGTPPADTGVRFTVGTDFSSPVTPTSAAGLAGLSYSFTYDNARFVMLDQFTRTDGTGSGSDNLNNYNIAEQQAWIDQALARKEPQAHAFVIGHKNLIGENHRDNLLGTSPEQNAPSRNAFIGSLRKHGVRFYISGHDHVYHRSIVTSPDGNATVQQIIGGSDSSKFYIPANPSPDTKYNDPTREIPIAQELNTIGYLVFTVDGPRVTVDYYSAEVNPASESREYRITATPALAFTKRDTFGYSLNGKEFLIPEGESYTSIQDRFDGTSARILDGINRGKAKDGSGRSLVKAVDTGWTEASDVKRPASSILTLWGMHGGLNGDASDTFVLSMTYDAKKVRSGRSARKYGLATRDAGGKWVNAADKISGGRGKLVVGPWKPAYGLGTFGLDVRAHTAWAVIDYGGDFVVAGDIPRLPAKR